MVELTREQALRRSQIISNVHYDLILSFFEHEKEFDGYIRVTFDLKEINDDVFLNFEGKDIKYCRVNDQEVPKGQEIFKDHMIHLPHDMLTIGKNQVDVRYTGLYRRDGIGLHRYKGKVLKLRTNRPFFTYRSDR